MAQHDNSERELGVSKPAAATDLSSSSNAKKASVLSRLGDAVASAKSGSDSSPRRARTIMLKENAFDGNQRGSKRQRLHHASTDADATDADATAASERKKRAVAPSTQRDTMARSRRLFGALMGHLGKAKAQIERDSALLQRQGAKQHDAERRDARAAAVAALEKQLARTTSDRTAALDKLQRAHEAQTRASMNTAGFVQTVASPPVLYLPAKLTSELTDLVAASREAHAAKQQRNARAYETQRRELDADFARKLEELRAQLAVAKQAEPGDPKTERVDERVEADAVAIASEEGAAASADATMNSVEAASSVGDSAAGASESVANGSDDSVDDAPMVETRDGDDDNDVAANETSPHSDDRRVHTRSSSQDRSAVDQDAGAASMMVSSTKYEQETSGSADSVDSSTSDVAASAVPSDEAPPPVETETETVVTVGDDSNERETAALEPETASATTTTTTTATAAAVDIDVSALKVTDLREQLKQRGLETKGLKAALVARLEAAMRHESDAATH